ncbi:MAG: response regulator, partial [Chloroflexi bacterium]|nr:response regulator [Chloroflexota bacterium]
MTDHRHCILFVDDDPLILRGLRRSTEEYLDVWEVEFANSATAALEQMAQQSFDAIITDLLMPGINGIQLLDYVNQQ